MITEFIMWLLGRLIEVLPDWSPLGFASEYVTSLLEVTIIQDALSVMMWLNHYAPVTEMVSLLGFTMLALGIGWTYSGIMWVWRNLPGKAT